MDTPDLQATMRTFNRILKPGGVAVLVFSHPCFPQGRINVSEGGAAVEFKWSFSYFEQRKCVDPPWAHFKYDFVWFHRPLSDYWKAFMSSGFRVADLDEPRITEDRYDLAEDDVELQKCRTRPYSIAFKLEKRFQPDAPPLR